jgi:hypothetical protein
MDTLNTFIIFVVVLFVYVHLTAQFKKSEDLEIYEMDYTTSQQLNEICELRQPVLFELRTTQPELFERIELKNDTVVNIKDKTDFETGDFIMMPYSNAETLIKTDPKSKFYSENNTDVPTDKTADELLKPQFSIVSKPDVLFGSKGARTATKFHTNSRKFICVKTGKVQIKMTPWKNRKYLHHVYDYTNYEFRSPIDVWDPQPKYLNDHEKVKFLEFDVDNGYVLYIPPYWFYSIKYFDEYTQLGEYNYNTIINCAANVPNYCMYYLQQSNINKKVLATVVSKSENENNTAL